jgi:predicted Zn-dependent peptidase
MIGQQIPGVQSVASVFWVNTGTRDEVAGEMGISHFLEHMAFRRTPHFGTKLDYVFESMGAEHNAATWKEFTYYWARVLSENCGQALAVLADLMRPVLTEEDFDQERGVILEEIARYQDNPSHLLFDSFTTHFFGDHPLAWDTLGTPETIKDLTVHQLRDYWGNRYVTHNVTFSIAGNFEWDAVTAHMRDLTQDWGTGEGGRLPAKPDFHPGFRVEVREKLMQEQIAIGVPSVAKGDPRYYAAALLSTILGDDTGSRLFWAVFQEGLAESAVCQAWDFDECGVMFVHLATDPGLAQRALEVTQAELERIQNFDVDQGELDRAKSKLISSEVIGGESTNNRVVALIDSWITQGRLETLEEIRRKIDDVTLEDLRSYVRDFPVWPQQVVTAVGPLGEDSLRNPTQ